MRLGVLIAVLALLAALLAFYHAETSPAEAPIRVVGLRPSSTSGWAAAEGSTRSYALMASGNTAYTSNDGGYAEAWV